MEMDHHLYAARFQRVVAPRALQLQDKSSVFYTGETIKMPNQRLKRPLTNRSKWHVSGLICFPVFHLWRASRSGGGGASAAQQLDKNNALFGGTKSFS